MNDPGSPDAEQPRRPVGFWLILVLAALYLGVRLAQGVGWLVDRLFG